MVDIRDLPGLNKKDNEHAAECTTHSIYCLTISYNETGISGKGPAIFPHRMAPAKPYTGGCVAIPENEMRFVMETVRPDCLAGIDSWQNISPATAEEWGI